MPVFMIERRFAEEFEPSIEGAADVNRINEDEGVQWLFSFWSKDKRKTFCLYEAESVEAIRRAAERAGLPADVVIEVSHRVSARGELLPITA
jgi:hypothetical protein